MREVCLTAWHGKNCLYGSEDAGHAAEQYAVFPSCLYGSEGFLFEAADMAHFLSCLYGSEA